MLTRRRARESGILLQDPNRWGSRKSNRMTANSQRTSLESDLEMISGHKRPFSDAGGPPSRRARSLIDEPATREVASDWAEEEFVEGFKVAKPLPTKVSGTWIDVGFSSMLTGEFAVNQTAQIDNNTHSTSKETSSPALSTIIGSTRGRGSQAESTC